MKATQAQEAMLHRVDGLVKCKPGNIRDVHLASHVTVIHFNDGSYIVASAARNQGDGMVYRAERGSFRDHAE